MKTKILIPLLLFFCLSLHAQDNINELLVAGLDDAEQFSTDYVAPAASALIYSLSNGWYNSGKAKKLGHFEISLVGNGTFINKGKKEFELNTADYNYLRFEDPNVQKMAVATAFGENDPDVTMVVEYQAPDGTTASTEITLPQGLGGTGVNVLPTFYLQGNVGIIKGTEIKVRFLPGVDMKGVKTSFYGGAIQHEITSWLPGEKIFPLHISVLVGYTAFKGSYEIGETHSPILDASNQKIETGIDNWLFTAIFSTKLPVINFYGGFGYTMGKATTDLKGTYHIKEGPLAAQTLIDPYSIKIEDSGIKATLGFKLKLGFFRLKSDYSFQKFNNIGVGLNFGF